MTDSSHLRALMLVLLACGLDCLDYGRDGVWDSPMATDYWVKRFGFMWAGGRSGMKGMEALQVRLEGQRDKYFVFVF